MALDKSPQSTNGCPVRCYKDGSTGRRGLRGWWDGLNCWFERRPVLVRLALVALVSLALWAVILVAGARLFA